MPQDLAPAMSGLSLSVDKDFQLSELFFSRTDGRGVIQSGNHVFQRISGFGWDELLNAPHRIIRHPDMPRAVFWILWSRLKKGTPVGAYVKNRTKNGNYYWVYAAIMPVSGGYLSVRMKPTSEVFTAVQQVYHDLRVRELELGNDLSPEDSASLLLEELRRIGHPNYTAFMGASLTAELQSKDRLLNKQVDFRLDAFGDMAKSVSDIFTESNALYADFRRIEQIPVNLRLQATRCEASGGPVSVISVNYSNLAREALAFATRFTDFGQKVLEQINMGLFLMGAARLQREMDDGFLAEAGLDTPLDHAQESARLRSHRQQCGDQARQTIASILASAEGFIEDSRRMRRFVGGLDVTRVTCRIETGWLPDADGGFQDIISKLDAFHADVERRMKQIDLLNAAIIDKTTALLNRSARFQAQAQAETQAEARDDGGSSRTAAE